MQAIFFLWCGGYLVKVEYLRTVGGKDLNSTARQLLKQTMLDAESLTADRCTIYLVQGCKLALAGDEQL